MAIFITKHKTTNSQYFGCFGCYTQCWKWRKALDPDFEKVVKARDERRRQGLHVIVLRCVEKYGKPAPEAFDEIVNILFTLLSFETFDTLAGSTQSIEEVSPLIQQLARSTLALDIR